MKIKHYMIVALSSHFSHTVNHAQTPEEEKFHNFVNFKTRANLNISVETSTQNAALLSSDDFSLLKHKASVFNVNGYKARILRNKELEQFQRNVMISNKDTTPKSRLN